MTRLHPGDLNLIIHAVRINTPWLDARECAEYLRCPISRVRRLTSTGDLPVERDGTRCLYHRDELDRFVRDGGAISP